ncbi:Proton channel OtopLc-like 2 [Homarus americanus]|uniref:Proton channel OtopLc-like 2 n=1 Tax=Homarus americanus TaxID=6706 RepID=A0A8J5NF47_HOMAM|nr:Proton channel OtopLc-like 2 [Homarus americanus]
MANSDDDNSSANLSFKLRRGSSDSRESFYMDFDRGIDSDIEEVSSKPRTSTFVSSVEKKTLECASEDEALIELRERNFLVKRSADDYVHCSSC